MLVVWLGLDLTSTEHVPSRTAGINYSEDEMFSRLKKCEVWGISAD